MTTLNFKNFKEYTPDPWPADAPARTIFIQDDDGNDWYKVMKEFSPDTYKIVYDSQKRITLINKLAEANIWPIGMSIVEVDTVPDDVMANWIGYSLDDNFNIIKTPAS